MKTATRDLVRLEGTYGEPIECNRILSCQPCDPRMIDQLNEGRLPGIRELRDLNRTRRKHIEITTSEKNRLQKVLEDANIKLGSVVSKIDGRSSMKMMHALLEKEVLSIDDISEMARCKLKSKVPQLVEALNGRGTEHHKFLLRFHLENIAFQADRIHELDEAIQKRMIPLQKEYHLIQTLPGISKTSAAAIIAEKGTDISQFPDEAHLSSWAGMCPGNNESAGIKKSGKTRKGNGFLKGILTEVAWAASRTKGSAYSAIYNGIAKRRGKKRALITLWHRILCDIYRVLTAGEAYVDEGDEAVFLRNSKAREGAMIRALERSGYAVTRVPA